MAKTKAPNAWRWLAGGLIVLGLGLLVTPTVVTTLTANHAPRVVTGEGPKIVSETKRIKRYNQALAQAQRAHRVLPRPTAVKAALHGQIGTVSVPSIHLKRQPIYYGTTEQTLASGVGVLAGTSLPSGGKNTLSVLSGHTGFNNEIIFDNIRHLKTGDIFYVSAFGQRRRAYRVFQRKVVKPAGRAAQAAIQVRPGQDVTVLLTCTPIFINSERLLVYGKRIPLATAAATKLQPRDLFSFQHVALMVAGVVVLALIGGSLTHRHYQKLTHQAQQAALKRRGPLPRA